MNCCTCSYHLGKDKNCSPSHHIEQQKIFCISITESSSANIIYFWKQLETESLQLRGIYVCLADKKGRAIAYVLLPLYLYKLQNYLCHQIPVYWHSLLSFWHSTMSARTLSEGEAELVFMLGSVQQQRCSRDTYSRLIDLEMIPASRMEVF